MSTEPPRAATRRGARRIAALVFLDLVGFSVVLPLLPVAAARYESRAVVIGALVATDAFLSFFLQPRWGRLSDRIGRRPVLIAGLLGSAVSYLVFGFAASFLTLLISRVISGTLSTSVTVAQAALADVTPPERRAHAMGLVGAAYGLAFTIGPALGGIANRIDERAPGLLAAAICTVAALIALLVVRETRAPEPAEQLITPPRASLRLLELPAVGITFGITFAFTVVYVIFPLFCQQVLGLDRSEVSYLFAVLGLVTIVIQGRVVGRLALRFRELELIVVGAVLMVLGLVVLPLVPALAVDGTGRTVLLITAVALLATGFGLVGPCTTGVVSRRARPGEQGRSLGALQSVGSMARIAGPPLLGGAVTAGGFGLGYGLAAGMAAMAGAMAWIWRRRA